VEAGIPYFQGILDPRFRLGDRSRELFGNLSEDQDLPKERALIEKRFPAGAATGARRRPPRRAAPAGDRAGTSLTCSSILF